jgi:Sec-independent protein secretion pathway component TatC
VAEPFTTSLKVSFALGFTRLADRALPALELRAPALTPKTQRGIAGFTVFAAGLLVDGVVFGYRVAIGVALPGVDPITTIVETIPLAILFEASIWFFVFFERRWFAPLSTVEGT